MLYRFLPVVLAACLLNACGAGPSTPTALAATAMSAPASTSPQVSTGPGCNVRGATASDGLDPFYDKLCNADGIVIASSKRVADSALVAAAEQILLLGEHRGDLFQQMVNDGARLTVMARDEVTTDVPEYADLQQTDPGHDWSVLRGVGGNWVNTVTVVSEENLLCLGRPADVYDGYDLLLHEWGHAMMNIGIRSADPMLRGAITDAYHEAMAAGLWQKSYAGTNPREYWAEGMQAFYNSTWDAERDPRGHGDGIDTREKLLAYDPALYVLLLEVLPERSWAGCHG
ncbi:MAG: hypothetical protein AAF515_14335 [Pseudomonadota bacterium]